MSSLKLEVGKYYRTRDGRRAGPVRPEDNGCYPDIKFSALVEGNQRNYRADGSRERIDAKCYPGLEIVAEWAECNPCHERCPHRNEGELEEVPTACPDPEHLCDAEIVARFNELVKAGRVRRELPRGSYPVATDLDGVFKLKPAAAPRKLKLPDSGYEVTQPLDGPLRVGCQMFESTSALINALSQICKYNAEGDSNLDLYAVRLGVLHEASGETITWRDADALLAFLEEGK